MVKDDLEIRDVDVGDIQKAQAIDWRLNNLYYSDLRTAGSTMNLNLGVPRDNGASFLRAWKNCRKRLRSGAVYDIDPNEVRKQMRRDSKKAGPMVRLINRAIRHIARRIHGK